MKKEHAEVQRRTAELHEYNKRQNLMSVMLEASTDAIDMINQILIKVLNSPRQSEMEIKKMMKAMRKEYKRKLRETVDELASKRLKEKKQAEEQAKEITAPAEPVDICVDNVAEFKKFVQKQTGISWWEKLRDVCRRF